MYTIVNKLIRLNIECLTHLNFFLKFSQCLSGLLHSRVIGGDVPSMLDFVKPFFKILFSSEAFEIMRRDDHPRQLACLPIKTYLSRVF